MEIMSPSYYMSSSSNANWSVEESNNSRGRKSSMTKWSHEENKIFENGLALYDKDTPDRWQRVADLIPGKTVADVMKQYKDLEDDVTSIEAGLWSVPGYAPPPGFTLDWGNNANTHPDHFNHSSYCPAAAGAKRSSSSSRPPDQERKKGVPWTEEEHKLFLMGLKKYGKGDWRNISRNFVITRTPTQVASHAQKYFIRQLSGGKDKRRASIHDITTVNLNDHTHHQSMDTKRLSSSPDEPTVHPHQQQDLVQWNHPNNNGVTMSFNSSMMMMSDPFAIDSLGIKMEGHNLHKGAAESYMGFQLQTMHHYSHSSH